MKRLLPISALLLFACGDSGDVGDTRTVTLDFSDPQGGDASGWQADFAGYSPEQQDIMEFASGHEPLPGALAGEGHGLMVGATNRSDDVFMYWTGPVQGLAPHTAYDVRFEVTFATDSPAGCVGIGGPPGEAVWVKTGMTAIEPRPELVDDYWLMNIDKGNQSQGGTDAIIVGDVANEGSGCHADERVWEFKTLESAEPFTLNTDADGNAWLIIGTDSGFEGRTELYYTELRAELTPR